MDEIKTAVDDLIEETRLRELTDEQIEWRIKKFTETCEEMIGSRVENARRRKMLLERLQIMKCFYDHSSIKHYGAGIPSRQLDERERSRRLQNIVKRRRMALEMIERVEPEVAQAIRESLEKTFAQPAPEIGAIPSKSEKKRNLKPIPWEYTRLSAHHWYFLYFNLFLLVCLILTIFLVVK